MNSIPHPASPAAVLTARRITKRFPGVTALREVSFDLRAGEIHALCGENGAGKSTLIKLLSGLHAHGSYEGELEVGGRPAHFRGIADAERAGLAVIYQELALVEQMSVAENICLGSEPRRGVFIDWGKVQAQAAALLEKFGVAIDPAAPVARLGIGEKQLVEIVKALAKDSRILILDEPTAALAEHEVQVLLGILRDLRRRGLACIYISHRLEEVFALADRITVLRDGASIGTWATGETDRGEVIRNMVGREIAELFPRRANLPEHGHPERSSGPALGAAAESKDPALTPAMWLEKHALFPISAATLPEAPRGPSTASFPSKQGKDSAQDDQEKKVPSILAVQRLTVADPRTGKTRLHDLTFALAPGEVLGIGGLMGAGRTELLMHLFGAWGERRSGQVWLDGAELARGLSPAEILPRGLALVSEDRRRYGLHLPEPIGFNLTLSALRRLVRGGLVDPSAEFAASQRQFRALGVKAPGLETPVGKLSGGNQQKVVLGKALMTEPRVVLLDEPTRGIDVGAKQEIYELIQQLTAAGKAVVLVSSELPELLGLSDRILMLHEGRLGGEFARAEATPERLLAAALGG